MALVLISLSVVVGGTALSPSGTSRLSLGRRLLPAVTTDQAVEIDVATEERLAGSIRCSRRREISSVYGQVGLSQMDTDVLEAQLLCTALGRIDTKAQTPSPRPASTVGAARSETDSGLSRRWHTDLPAATKPGNTCAAKEQCFLKGALSEEDREMRATGSFLAPIAVVASTEATVAASPRCDHHGPAHW